MTRTPAAALVRQLTSAGYGICTFSLTSEGNYAAADADWNYKDVPHLNIVHTKVRALIATMDDDQITTINLQKILGIPWPLALVNYATSERSQTYFTALGPYVLVVQTEYDEVAPNRTRVTTTYNVAASGIARLAFPLLRRIITGNYRTLMSEDLPMRDRRGALRRRGFSFASDGRARTFPETTNLLVENVRTPERQASRVESVDLEALAAAGSSVFIGTDDDCGLRLVRDGSNVLFFPRYCSHEGASVDDSPVRKGRVTCPWHAKQIGACGTLSLAEPGSTRFGEYAAAFNGTTLSVTLPSAEAAPGRDSFVEASP